jgi:hypothetical protein
MRADGYGDSVNVFQGVRAYDPNSAQWTAPDAYAGEVHDPISQKPYMWNRSNALTYGDPSGFDTEISKDMAPLIDEMAKKSSIFAAQIGTLNGDHSHTFVYRRADPADSGYPGAAGLFHAKTVNGRWDGRTYYVDVKADGDKNEEMHVAAHETAHAVDFAADPSGFGEAQGSQTLCASSDPNCNDEEARAQLQGDAVDQQLGIDPSKYGQYHLEDEGDFTPQNEQNSQSLFVDYNHIM